MNNDDYNKKIEKHLAKLSPKMGELILEYLSPALDTKNGLSDDERKALVQSLIDALSYDLGMLVGVARTVGMNAEGMYDYVDNFVKEGESLYLHKIKKSNSNLIVTNTIKSNSLN